MKKSRIYQGQDLTIDQTIELDKTASHHLGRVLRYKSDDLVTLFNGDGFEYEARLEFINKKVFAHIVSKQSRKTEPDLKITLLQGISKGDHMDFAIQKAVELGAHEIVPVICERTVVNLKADRINKKLLHWQGIIVNASEQSYRNVLTSIRKPIKIADIFNNNYAQTNLVLDPNSSTQLKNVNIVKDSVSLLVGPEGGLTENEIAAAKNNSFVGISMGPRILRTETAALASISAIQTLWGDF